MKINSVLGILEADDLGQVLVHEHVSCADWSMRTNFGSTFFDYDGVRDLAVTRLREAKACGVNTVVDGTPINLGRDIRLLRDAAEASGISIIASTGFYFQCEPWLASRNSSQIKKWLLQECTEGISGTGILPGVLKTAVDNNGMTDYHRKLIRITGEVAAETKLPVFCHSNARIRNCDEAFQILVECGVPANHIIMGHCGDCVDIEYLEALLEQGVQLGMDRFATVNDAVLSLPERIAVVAKLCCRGWSNRLFLSHDAAVYLAFFDYWGDHRDGIVQRSEGAFTRIHQKVLPELLSLGVTKSMLHQILVENPRRFLACEGDSQEVL